jgi:Family of unknown function (DUF6636)
MLGPVAARTLSSYRMTTATGHANDRNASVMTIKITQFALIATATITLPAHAHASGGFASPSGNIACDVLTRDDGANFATCDIRDHTYVAPPKPANCQLSGWGDRVNMVQGSAPGFSCHGDINVVPGLPTLPYGQTRSAGPMTCDSEPSGMTCTDTSTGHYFRISHESYELG